ncbi:microtubule-associated protein 9 isoform X3 [Columba livia]|uniref:microtubule-associated protein 9 isoform X3 n=1 Tax=Columba livia TaxID=8932 RepID=UPI0031BA5143
MHRSACPLLYPNSCACAYGKQRGSRCGVRGGSSLESAKEPGAMTARSHPPEREAARPAGQAAAVTARPLCGGVARRRAEPRRAGRCLELCQVRPVGSGAARRDPDAAAMPGKRSGRRAARRRGVLQGERQKALSAHAAREQAAEYSDDKESDKDGTLNGIGKELNGRNSGAGSTKKLVAVDSPLSDEYASQKAADLEKEAADDSTLSFHEKKLPQTMLLESENIQDGREDGEEECLESQNEDDNRKNNQECSAPEEAPCGNGESEHCNDLPIHELQEKRNQERSKPIRECKTRNASASDHDPKTSTSDLEVEDNSGKSHSVTEVMKTTVDEKTKELEKSTDDSSDEMVKIAEGQIVTDTTQKASVNDRSEHGEAKSTSKDSVKKTSETKERALQNAKVSVSERGLSSAHLKKKVKAVASATTASPQYLGTLKLLENERVWKNSTEFDKADSLRAAVFQNWLEKKRAALLQSKRIEKEKAENLRNNIEKKEAVKREEANAAFEAWKKKKAIEAKKLREKKKLEELKEKKATEQNKEKAEAAQKAFEKWKERKAEYLREQSRKEKQSERIRKKKEEELVAEKKRDSMSAVEKWNEKKEEYMKKKKVEKILEKRKQEIQQAEKEEKDKKAVEEYDRWLEKKERKEQLDKKQKKMHAVHGDEAPSPWSPPGKVTYSRN